MSKKLKLASKYYGPFTIMEKVGHVVSKLQLPTSSTIHLVFHVSFLKKKVRSNRVPTPFMPLVRSNGQLLTQLFKILDRRIAKKG